MREDDGDGTTARQATASSGSAPGSGRPDDAVAPRTGRAAGRAGDSEALDRAAATEVGPPARRGPPVRRGRGSGPRVASRPRPPRQASGRPRGSVYFTLPVELEATPASSYQPSTRATKPRRTVQLDLQFGQGQAGVQRWPAVPRVSRGDSARPSDRSTARAAPPMPSQWLCASTAAVRSARRTFSLEQAASIGHDGVDERPLPGAVDERACRRRHRERVRASTTSCGGQLGRGDPIPPAVPPLLGVGQPDDVVGPPWQDEPVEARRGRVADHRPGPQDGQSAARTSSRWRARSSSADAAQTAAAT